MYKTPIFSKTNIKRNESTEGETIEQKVQRVTVNKEPIKDGAPLIYTERKEGVKASHNIRTDRFEIAVEAMDVVSKTVRAKREEKPVMKIVKDEPIQGTEGTNN
jgi:hypothetical protein